MRKVFRAATKSWSLVSAVISQSDGSPTSRWDVTAVVTTITTSIMIDRHKRQVPFEQAEKMCCVLLNCDEAIIAAETRQTSNPLALLVAPLAGIALLTAAAAVIFTGHRIFFSHWRSPRQHNFCCCSSRHWSSRQHYLHPLFSHRCVSSASF